MSEKNATLQVVLGSIHYCIEQAYAPAVYFTKGPMIPQVTPDTTPEPAPSARRQETQTRLLDAAAEVFIAEGFQATSVEAVCARAGFTRGAFYSNFSSKEELFLAVSRRAYEHRAVELEQRERELTPLLLERDGALTHDEVAKFVANFFTPTLPEAAWFVLESEYQLHTMRNPDATPALTDFISMFKQGLIALVSRVVDAAGRELTIPVESAIRIMGGMFERAMRISVISGPEAPEGLAELSDRIAELLFAISVEVAA